MEREAMAERPQEYRIDGITMDDILSTIFEAKGLAQTLLSANEVSTVVSGPSNDFSVSHVNPFFCSLCRLLLQVVVILKNLRLIKLLPMDLNQKMRI